MELFEGKYHLWQGDIKYHAIHAKKRGRIGLVSGEKAMKEIIASVNGFDTMKQQRDELLAALKDARATFELAYNCAEKKFHDECLLHLGIGGARADKIIAKCEA